MGEPFIGEIRMFGGNFPPAGWALCQGQLMAISQNDTLFTLIGTTYGGDGQETFGIPDLQGRCPMHAGQGPGISQTYQLGEKAGVESVTLGTNQIPIHTHGFLASTGVASSLTPTNQIVAQSAQRAIYYEDTSTTNLAANSLAPAGGSQPHENMQPFLCINFIISLFGVFPSQN
ncbi:MAG: tail fiber protein [Betaproteobacteria bacterium]